MTEFAASSDIPSGLPPTLQGLRALILTDGKMGDLAQCRGVAQALGATWDEVTVSPGKLAALAGWRGRDPAFEALMASPEKPPHLLLASGRRTVPYLTAAKKRWGAETLTAFLKDPRTGAQTADVIWVPTHDALRGANVIVTDTGPHGWTQAKKARQASALRARLSKYPRPWLGVLLGGVTKKVQYQQPTINALISAIETAGKHAGSVIITPSRRTPEPLKQALGAVHRHTWVWNEAGDNPYGGILGACDAFLVTGDSHNMVSEVLSAGQHTMVFRPKGIPRKFVGFLDSLEKQGMISPPGVADFEHTQLPLDATPTIANSLAEVLQRRIHWPS